MHLRTLTGAAHPAAEGDVLGGRPLSINDRRLKSPIIAPFHSFSDFGLRRSLVSALSNANLVSHDPTSGVLGEASPLVDMPNDDVSPVDIGTDATSQLHIIEMDNGHSTLALKRQKAFRGFIYDHLGCDGWYVQKITGRLRSLGVIAIVPSEGQ
jgi:hypothetical protein